MTARQAEYQDYLGSSEWQERRLAALQRAEHRCQLCYSGKQLQVHHRTYERVGNELPSDLTVLCNKCHERFHGITSSKKPSSARRSGGKHKKGKVAAARLRVLEVLPNLQPGVEYSLADIGILTPAGSTRSAIAQALPILVREHKLVRISKKRYRVPGAQAPKAASRKRREPRRANGVGPEIRVKSRP